VPLTVAQVHEMLQAGWLADGEAVELVEGVLVRKDRSAAGEGPMTHGKRHSSAVAMLRRRRPHAVRRDFAAGQEIELSLPGGSIRISASDLLPA
jgi:hypothetical protein